MDDREKTIDAFSKCIRIGDEGFLNADCEHCPNKSDAWNIQGKVCCEDFEELSVEVPWQLAKDMLELVKGQEAGFSPKEIKMYPGSVWACGNCGHVAVGSLAYKAKYCPECGKMVCWSARPGKDHK